jgi:hypothetical protein
MGHASRMGLSFARSDVGFSGLVSIRVISSRGQLC